MFRPSIVRAIGAFLLLLAGPLPCPAQDACLTIGIGTGGAYAEERAALVEAIFSKAGLCAKPLLVPLSRLDRMEDKGELDGNAWHDDSYLASHSEMAKVPTPVEHFRGSLFWLRGREDPSHVTGATIGILLGREWPRDALDGLPVSIYEASSYTQLFELTESGRLQGMVIPTEVFGKLAPNQDWYQSRVVRAVPLYLVVKSRYQSLIPALDKAIKAMKSSGAIHE